MRTAAGKGRARVTFAAKDKVIRVRLRNNKFKGNKQKRYFWAQEHKEWTLDQRKSVLWSNESNFEIFGSARCSLCDAKKVKAWSPHGCFSPWSKEKEGLWCRGALLVTLLLIYSKWRAHWTSMATSSDMPSCQVYVSVHVSTRQWPQTHLSGCVRAIWPRRRVMGHYFIWPGRHSHLAATFGNSSNKCSQLCWRHSALFISEETKQSNFRLKTL